jgi:2,4-dienoyl-CoA reductase-like NADH-dependent reductase (Old Yellow Enzyme family)
MTIGLILRRMLASPLALRSGAVLPNRLAKAAMSEALADHAGAPTDALVRLYERWGRSGAGLLVTGHVIVDPDGVGERGNVVVTDDLHRAALRRWAEAAQANGAQLWMQLNHAGRQSPRGLVREPVAPSRVAMRGAMARLFGPPRELTAVEIETIVGRFATAAAVARDAGFAGIQLHAAHGYLVSQFLSPRTNRRDDAWGGDAGRRARFLLEIVAAMRRAVGPRFPIGVKLNSADFQRGGFAVDDAIAVARLLDGAGIDLLEVSGGNYESPAMAGSGELLAHQRASSREREAYFLDYARQIRAATAGALAIMLTGGMRSRTTMDDALASGAIDVVGMARPLTHTPDLPARLLDGSLAAAPPVRIRSRIRAIDDALQALWFQAQIHELAHGREPDLALGKLSALWRGLRGMALAS